MSEKKDLHTLCEDAAKGLANINDPKPLPDSWPFPSDATREQAQELVRKAYSCDYCEQSFATVVERIEHERTHKQWQV